MKDKSRILSIASILLTLLTAISLLFLFLDITDYSVGKKIFIIFALINLTFESATNYHLGKPIESSNNNKWLRLFFVVLGLVLIFIAFIQLFSL